MRFGFLLYPGVEPIDLAAIGVVSMARRLDHRTSRLLRLRSIRDKQQASYAIKNPMLVADAPPRGGDLTQDRRNQRGHCFFSDGFCALSAQATDRAFATLWAYRVEPFLRTGDTNVLICVREVHQAATGHRKRHAGGDAGFQRGLCERARRQAGHMRSAIRSGLHRGEGDLVFRTVVPGSPRRAA